MTIQEALNSIYNLNYEVEYEECNLMELKNRVLKDDIFANYNSPLFTNSAMDGYALKYNEVTKGLKCLGSIFAGDNNNYSINSGECYKIMTGARVPKGANAVLMVEKSIIKDELVYATVDSIKEGEAIRYEGEEYTKGSLLLKKGIIKDEDIMILASNGIYKTEVAKKINVGIFASGAELIEPYMALNGVYNSNAYGIYSIFKSIANPNYLGILKDEYEYVLGSLKGATEAYDLVVSIGAASMGDADFIKKALGELGFNAVFTKVKMKPAGPVSLYQNKNKLVLVLPGNPMSAYIGALMYAKELIYKMQGVKYSKQVYTAKLSQDLKINNGKENIVIGTLEDGVFIPFNNAKISSGQLTPLNKTTHFIICPIECNYAKDDKILVYEKNI